MLERGFSPAEGGVYISYYLFGSPAHKYKLVPKNWLLEINGQTVAGLDSFVALVQAPPSLPPPSRLPTQVPPLLPLDLGYPTSAPCTGHHGIA